jgi:predicted transcriptional regulator
MDVSRPYAAVVPSLDGDVLVALARVTKPLTGREIAQLAHRGSPSSVAAVLDRLVEHGLVLREKAGRANLHRLNREHVAAAAVEALAKARSSLFERIGRHVETWDPPVVNVTLFGSTARGDGDTRSDIDLLVVRPSDVAEGHPGWSAQIDDLTEAIFTWTGNHAAIIQTGQDRLSSFAATLTPIVDSLERDGIDLAGTNLRTLLRDARSQP